MKVALWECCYHALLYSSVQKEQFQTQASGPNMIVDTPHAFETNKKNIKQFDIEVYNEKLWGTIY